MAAISQNSIALSSSSSSSSSGLRRSLPRAVGSSCSTAVVFSSRRSANFPKFAGLKIHSRPCRSLASVSSRNFRRSAKISCEIQEVSVDVPTVTDATWESLVLKADGPVVVEFWASWCGPCRMIDPVMGELANEYAGKLQFFKLNTDESPSIATQYGIKSIPTILMFVNGEKKDFVLGAVPKTTLIASIEKIL